MYEYLTWTSECLTSLRPMAKRSEDDIFPLINLTISYNTITGNDTPRRTDERAFLFKLSSRIQGVPVSYFSFLFYFIKVIWPVIAFAYL